MKGAGHKSLWVHLQEMSGTGTSVRADVWSPGLGVNGEISWVGMCECYFGDEEKVLKLITVMDAQLWIHGHWTICCAWVNYIACEFYHNKASTEDEKQFICAWDQLINGRVRDDFKPLSPWSMTRMFIVQLYSAGETTQSIRWGSKVSQIV